MNSYEHFVLKYFPNLHELRNVAVWVEYEHLGSGKSVKFDESLAVVLSETCLICMG